MVGAAVNNTGIEAHHNFSEKQTHIKNGVHKNDKFYGKQNINEGEEDQMEVLGYRPSFWGSVVTWVGYVLTLGVVRLLFHWYPHWHLKATHDRCSLADATKVLVVDNFQGKCKSYFVKDIKYISTCDISLSDLNQDNIISTIEKQFVGVKNDKLTFQLEDGSHKEVETIRAFRVKKLCYIWDNNQNKFMKLSGLDVGVKNADFHNFSGFSAQEQILRRITYGQNEINVPVQSILTLLVLEALNPFYIFQVFTLAVWLAEYYYYYTVAIIIMSVFGIASSIIQTRKNQLNLRGTVHSTEKVRVSRGNEIVEDILSTDLVPGDVILVPAQGCTMLCDAVLLEGNCIVNESMLTGESVPVTKTPLPQTDILYNIREDTNHTLFCGTRVIQTRFYGGESVRAVVIRTGYLTTKGQLVRSILYPPPADFKFDQDSYRFIGILAFIAFLGFLYTVISKSTRGLSATDIIIKALDIITIVVPPALPAAMTVGKLYAISRLKKKQIYCMNSRVINVTGSINCVCFDKTGTLTEDGLDMWGVVPVAEGTLGEAVKDVKSLPEESPLLMGMVSCHSLTIIDDHLSGDPLDVKMFESTGWTLEEPEMEDSAKFDLLVPTVVKAPTNVPRKFSSISQRSNISHSEQVPVEVGIVQQYQFSSSLQRMSVVTRMLGTNHFQAYCKGSPEMIISLSKPETVPSNLVAVLKTYTEQGYRVIALGTRILDVDANLLRVTKMHRDQVEMDLTFVGLIILENQLKPETAGVIDTLKNADIKVVMITGDNIQTALSVARECRIVNAGDKIFDTVITTTDKTHKIDFIETGLPLSIANCPELLLNQEDVENNSHEAQYHLALTGKTWALAKEYFPEMIPKLVTKGTVFARMSSDQKQQLVQELQALGYYVAMCGDGANDCGALKAAHTGVSLSEAESSVASPFTSRQPNISCVPKVIREGRAALVTSFGVFKFMVAYSLTEFLSVIILYGIDSNLTSFEFLFIDICLVVNFASFFGKTQAYSGPLVKEPPMTSLLGFTPLVSLIAFMAISTFFQYLAYYVIQSFDWFVPFKYNPDNPLNFSSYENYAVFCVSLFQYIIMSVVYSKGKPYRQPVYSNLTLFSSIVIMIIVCSYITIYPADWLINTLEIKLPPSYDIRLIILAMALVNFVVCLFVESFFVEFILHQKITPRFQNIDKTSKKYLKIEQELKETRWLTGPKSLVMSNGNGVLYENETKNGYVNTSFQDTENATTVM